MGQHEELLALHTLLMCPAECPPIQDGDTQTVRLLKGLIDNWHTLATTGEALRAENATLKLACETNNRLLDERTDQLNKLDATAAHWLQKAHQYQTDNTVLRSKLVHAAQVGFQVGLGREETSAGVFDAKQDLE